jgi:hypothetical protein
MPEPRRRPSWAATRTDARPIAGEAEARRRQRAGQTRGPLIWTTPRNGLPPLKPYVYRGTGYDIYEETGQ